MNLAIEAQSNYIKELYSVKEMKQLRMRLLFHIHGADYTKRQVFAALKYRYEVYKRN